MKKLMVLVGALILVLLFWRVCDVQQSEGRIVKVGAVLPLTGRFSDAGMAIQAGLELARQDISVNGGVEFELCFFDTKSEAKNAMMGYNKLSTIDGARLFFTTISENGMVMKPVVLRDGGALFGILSHVDLLRDGNGHVFRFLQTGEDEANYLSDYVLNTVNAEKVVLFVFNAEAGKAFQQVFRERLGNRICKMIEFGEEGDSLRSLVASVNFTEADCVVVVGYSAAMGTVAKLVRQAGFQKDIVANIGFNTPSVIAAAGNAASTVVFNDYDLPYGTEEHDSKVSRSLKQFNTQFSSLSYIAYGAMCLLNAACMDSDKVPEESVKLYLSGEKAVTAGGVSFHIHNDGRVITGLKMSKLEK